MSAINPFFIKTEVKEGMLLFEGRLRKLSSGSSDGLAAILIDCLAIVRESGADFDKHAQISIQHAGRRFLEALDLSTRPFDTAQMQAVAVLLYRFVVEYELSTGAELAMSLDQLKSYVINNCGDFPPPLSEHLSWIQQTLPISILKSVFNTKDLTGFRNIAAFKTEVEQKFGLWDLALNQHEKTVEGYKNALVKLEKDYNFVLLYDGFNDLSKAKAAELKGLRRVMVWFGALATVPPLTELLWLSLSQEVLGLKSPYFLGATGLITLTISFLLIYFFRIALRSADSAKAQLLQIELRKTLCRFIQSYADYSSVVHKNNPGALEKFEAIIFSGIVANEDKLPSAFDGIDQLANLMKAVKTKST